MSITMLNDGRFKCRLTIPTTQRDGKNKLIRCNRTKTFDTKGAAEAWERREKKQVSQSGSESSLSFAQVSEYKDVKQLLSDEVDLREVVRFWLRHKPNASSVTVNEAYDKYKQSREFLNLAKRTQEQRKHVLNQFIAEFGEQQLQNVVIEEVESYLGQFENTVTRNTRIQAIRGLFNWSTDRRHRLISINQLHGLRAELVEFKQPEFISPNDVHKLFSTAVKTDPGFIPYMALGFFAGIRTAEIERMEARDFHFEDKRINIRPEVAKRKRVGKELPRQLEELPETIWRWFKAVGFEGKIDKVNAKARYASIYETTGVHRCNNAARHTFATHSYALLSDAGKVRKWTGHRTNDTIFLNHYAGLTQKKNGKAYFKILPKGQIIVAARQNPNNLKGLSDADLLKMKASATNVEIAKKLSVSETAIRKRLKRISANDHDGSASKSSL